MGVTTAATAVVARRRMQQLVLALALALALLPLLASAFVLPLNKGAQGQGTTSKSIIPQAAVVSGRCFGVGSSSNSGGGAGSWRRFSSSSSSEAAAAKATTEGAKSADEELMEELIACPWDQLEEFSNKHYKFLIHPEFYMKLADRIYQLPTQEEQDEAADKATKIWNRLLKVLNAAEEQRASTAEMLQKMVAQAAEADGQFYFPLAPERIEAVRAEVLKHLDRMDEGALTTLNAWVLKVQDDQDNQAMTEVLQKVLQFYAGGVLMRAKGYDRPDSTSGSLVFFRNLLNANPADWDMLLFNGLKVDGVCTAEQLTEEIGAMIQGVVLSLPEGSLTQRVQAEYLRELMSRVSNYAERDPRAF